MQRVARISLAGLFGGPVAALQEAGGVALDLVFGGATPDARKRSARVSDRIEAGLVAFARGEGIDAAATARALETCRRRPDRASTDRRRPHRRRPRPGPGGRSHAPPRRARVDKARRHRSAADRNGPRRGRRCPRRRGGRAAGSHPRVPGCGAVSTLRAGCRHRRAAQRPRRLSRRRRSCTTLRGPGGASSTRRARCCGRSTGSCPSSAASGPWRTSSAGSRTDQ